MNKLMIVKSAHLAHWLLQK